MATAEAEILQRSQAGQSCSKALGASIINVITRVSPFPTPQHPTLTGHLALRAARKATKSDIVNGIVVHIYSYLCVWHLYLIVLGSDAFIVLGSDAFMVLGSNAMMHLWSLAVMHLLFLEVMHLWSLAAIHLWSFAVMHL